MMRPSHAIDERDPEPRVFLELGELMGVNNVSDVAGNQSKMSLGCGFATAYGSFFSHAWDTSG